MGKIEDQKKALNEVKETAYSIYFVDRHASSYEKLVNLKGVDKELYETLLLVHSNYITSAKEQNLAAFKMVTKLADINIEICNCIAQLEKIEQVKKEEEAKGWLTTTNLIRLSIPVVGIIFAFWLMHLIGGDSFTAATNFFTSLIGLNK